MKIFKKSLMIFLSVALLVGSFGTAVFATENIDTYEAQEVNVTDGTSEAYDSVAIAEAISANEAAEETLTDAGENDADVEQQTAYEEESEKEQIGGGTTSEDDVTETQPGNVSDEPSNEDATGTSPAEDADDVTDIGSQDKINKAPAKADEKIDTTIDKDKEETTEEETTKEEIKIKSIKLDVTKKEMATRESFKINATVTPENATEKVVWTSSDEDIATVDKNGNVKAKRYGTVTITASSESGDKKATCEIKTRFYDVNYAPQYYYEPVYWAADKGITLGYDNVYFGPQRTCTRKEMVIFLWRYSGKPSSSAKISFKDVKYEKNTDGHKAIQWAVGKGIIKGYDDKTFKPDNAVSRKDAMIMLYRMAGKPKVSGNVRFSDVTTKKYSKGSDTYKSILWGTTVGITNGYSNGQFKPASNCLREHIVTFLYRYKDKKSDLAYLATPGSLKAEISGKALKFSWKAVKNAKNYDVYRYVYKNKKFQKVATVNDTSWTYKDVKSGDTHKFKVVARSGKISSESSAAVTGVYLSTPSLKSVKAASNNFKVEVKWGKVSGASGYKVYRKTGNGGWKLLGKTSKTTYNDNSFKLNTKCTYTVRAYKKVDKEYLSLYNGAGKSITVKDSVREMAQKRLKANGNTLRDAFNWSNKIKYIETQSGSTTKDFATYTFKNSRGDCLGKAASFCYMARELGYEAYLVTGYIPGASGNMLEHGWVEIKVKEKWYVCDLTFHEEGKRNGYMIQYGQKGTWRYTDYHRLP